MSHFITTNEFVCFTDLGYKTGRFAPGLKLPDAQVNQIRHHGILAHGLGVQAIRANAKPRNAGGPGGECERLCAGDRKPRAHRGRAARHARGQRAVPHRLMEGKYTDGYLEHEGANAPKVEPGDMKTIGSPLDFVGLNVYTPEYVRADPRPPATRSSSARPRIRTWRRRGSTSGPK